MKKVFKNQLVIVFALMSGSAFASAGAALYQPCAACHGAAGEGNISLFAPALAGQDAAYLARQLENFQRGVRGADPRDTHGAQMKAMAMPLSDGDIAALSTYLAGLDTPTVAPAEGADMMNGNNYYQSKCGACHGGKAQGNSGLNSPALSLLDGAYLKRQFMNFQKGIRGSHADDRFGRQMKMMASALPEEKDLNDVIAFIHAQGAQE